MDKREVRNLKRQSKVMDIVCNMIERVLDKELSEI